MTYRAIVNSIDKHNTQFFQCNLPQRQLKRMRWVNQNHWVKSTKLEHSINNPPAALAFCFSFYSQLAHILRVESGKLDLYFACIWLCSLLFYCCCCHNIWELIAPPICKAYTLSYIPRSVSELLKYFMNISILK